MADKICNNCGSRVHLSVNYCPYCKSSSFRNLNEITAPNNSLKYRMLYWGEDNYFILSKSKVAALITFVVFSGSLIFSTPVAGIVFSAVIAILVYIIGFSIHRILGRDHLDQKILAHSDYGLITDLKHMFMYWQDKHTGQFEFSKTKSISLLIFLLIASLAVMFNAPNLLAIVLSGLMFSVPAFAVGYVIHRFTTAKPVKKVIENVKPIDKRRETKEAVVTSDFDEYRARLNKLKRIYSYKEAKVRELIEKRFEPPQLTYTRFITAIDNSKSVFDTQAEEISDIISLSTNLNDRLKKEIDAKFTVLDSIIGKMDDLASELVVTMDSVNENDVHNLIDDMENLAKSVKDYDLQ